MKKCTDRRIFTEWTHWVKKTEQRWTTEAPPRPAPPPSVRTFPRRAFTAPIANRTASLSLVLYFIQWNHTTSFFYVCLLSFNIRLWQSPELCVVVSSHCYLRKINVLPFFNIFWLVAPFILIARALAYSDFSLTLTLLTSFTYKDSVITLGYLDKAG